MRAILPPLVESLVTAYLDLVDAEVPGLIEGVYLTGSIALADFRPGRSDVDFVAVTEARPGTRELTALQQVHATLTARLPAPLFEGLYVTLDALARDPAAVGPVPFVHARQFHAAGRFEVSPVTWAILARHGVVLRGPPAAELAVHDDPSKLAQWTRQNLVEHWRPWQAQRGRLFTRGGLAALGSWASEWGVLGVSRLHYTLTTGQIASKYAAGLYALHRFPPRWHPIIVEALRIRRGDGGRSVYRLPSRRRADLLAYVGMVVDNGLALPSR